MSIADFSSAVSRRGDDHPEILSLPDAWKRLKRIEPRLASLESKAHQVRPKSRDFWHRYEAVKAELTSLVGWEARHPCLRGSEMYDFCHARILRALETSPRKKHGGPN